MDDKPTFWSIAWKYQVTEFFIADSNVWSTFQVSTLKKFYYNEFHFSPENIKAVKNSIWLSSNTDGSLFGKTGTMEVRHQNDFFGAIIPDSSPNKAV